MSINETAGARTVSIWRRRFDHILVAATWESAAVLSRLIPRQILQLRFYFGLIPLAPIGHIEHLSWFLAYLTDSATRDLRLRGDLAAQYLAQGEIRFCCNA